MTATAFESSPLAELRRGLIANGYRPVPVNGKRPRIKGWPNLKMQEAQVDGYIRKYDDHTNTGIICGTIVAIDIDVPDPATAEKLIAHLMDAPAAMQAPCRTGKAPKCLFLFRAAVPSTKRSTGRYAINDQECLVEVLGVGQQFVAYGEHPDTGASYTWQNGEPLTVPLATLPEIAAADIDAFLTDAEAILAAAGSPIKKAAAHDTQSKGGDTFWTRVNSAALANVDAWVPSLFASARRESGTGAWRVSSKDLGRSLDEDISIHGDGVRDFGEERPSTPIQLVIDYGGAATPKDAAHWLCERLGVDPSSLGWETRKTRMAFDVQKIIAAANDNEEKDDALPPITGQALPEALCYPPGAVGAFARFITSCSRFPSPHLSLVASLALVAVLIGRRYKGPTGLRSNAYLVGLAESGFGKDITIRAAEAIAESGSDGGRITEVLFADKLRSLPGLAGKLRKSPAALAVIDEFGKFLGLHTGRNVAPHREELANALMELTGAPMGTWGGAEKAEGNIARIVQPCLVLHGVSTPSTFWDALSSGNISEGLLGRFVVIDAGDGQPIKVRRPAGTLDVIPSEFGETIDGLLGGNGGGRFGKGSFYALTADSKSKPWPMITAAYAPGVDDLFEAFDDRMRAMMVDPQYRPIRSRVGENAARLALIVAVGCDPKEPIITREIQEWANAVAEASFRTIMRGADNNIADNDKSREYLRIKRMIDDAKSQGMTLGIIARRVKGSLDLQRLDSVVTQLQISGEVVYAEQPGSRGQTRSRYWAREHLPEDASPKV
jgi:hypothetical protein